MSVGTAAIGAWNRTLPKNCNMHMNYYCVEFHMGFLNYSHLPQLKTRYNSIASSYS